MDYKELDDQVFALVEKHGSEVFTAGLKSQFPETLRAMAMFCGKANSLKTAMFDAIDNNNPMHSASCTESCEHYLKFMYLLVRIALIAIARAARRPTSGIGNRRQWKAPA